MGEIKTNVDTININSMSEVANQNSVSADTLVNNSIAPVDTLDVSSEVSNISTMAKEGTLDKNSIDFSRISATAGDALNGNFINRERINDNYWGDNGELTYKIRDDGTIMIFENGTLLGFTDRLGATDAVVEKVIEEVLPVIEEAPTAPTITEPQVVQPVVEEPVIQETVAPEVVEQEPINLVYREYSEPVPSDPSNNHSIVSGLHYTTGNTTYPMTEADLYRVISCIEAESNGDYEDALGVASVIANRIDDGRYSATTPVGIVSYPGQFAAWDASKAERYANDPTLCKNPEIVRAAIDVFNNGIRNNDYVEFKSAGSSDYSITGELKYQIVDGGNKFHNLAQSLDRVDTYLASAESQIPSDSDNVRV